MLGFMEASRYITKRSVIKLELECRALTSVRNEMGLTNVEIAGAVRTHPAGEPGCGFPAGRKRFVLVVRTARASS